MLGLAASAKAHHGTPQKGIWGPSTPKAFRIYHSLGVGLYEHTVSWRDVATRRPADATDPNDPAYAWPTYVDDVLRRADRYGIRVMLMLVNTPPWANGGREPNWAPDRAADLADFATAAARRYPSVRRWMIWGEPTRQAMFMPLDPETPGKRLTRRERRGPRLYARMLDASYGALKGVSPRNLVIGGNSFTMGHVSPLNWIRGMRLPNGKRPRMDMYGHNPYGYRRPDLSQPRFSPSTGNADFSDLDTLMRWLDRHGYRDHRGRRLPVFISEYSAPTDHVNAEMNFWVTHEVQAQWARAALRIVRRHPRLPVLGWYALYDDPPHPDGLEVNRGLIDIHGRKKPSFYAFRRG